jgi:lipopolysaccharide heptosyltransferase II
MLCRLAGIPLRLAPARENPYDLLTDWVPDTEVCATGMRHEVERQLALVRAVGFHADDEHLQFRYRVAEVLAMRRKFEQAGGDLRRPYVVVHPGASAASRRWPAERFGQAAEAIAAATGCQVLFIGGVDEAALVAQARAAMRAPSLSLAGQLALGELAALIAGAQVTLCNNSGPAHIAAAVGAPVVVLYALTNPQHTPWKGPSRVLNRDVPCRHCLKSACPETHHACLKGVQPGEVSAAALDIIHAPPGVPLHRMPAAAPMAMAAAS